MSSIEPGPARTRYRLGPLEQRGIVAGWRAGQLVTVALALVVAVGALRSRPSIGGAALAVLVVGAGVALACVPVRGRSAEQWVPLVGRYAWSGVGGRRRWTSPAPGAGQLVDAGERCAGPQPTPDRRSPPGHVAGGPPTRALGALGGLRLVAADGVTGGPAGPVGLLVDDRSRTVTVVLAVRGHSFALLASHDQDRLVGGWGRTLASLAREGTVVHRLQWVETCVPDDGYAVAEDREHRGVPASGPAGASYDRLVEEVAPVTRRHRVLVALAIHLGRAGRQVRAAGGGVEGAARLLGREAAALARLLADADVEVDGLLGPRALSEALHLSFGNQPPWAVGGGDAGRRRDPSWPWPLAVEPSWDAVRVDGTWHATYWVSEWPRSDVTPEFLGPLLFLPVRRALSVTMEPVTPSRAARQVARARTADRADAELRRRGGFLATARQARERAAADERDAELADGHAQFRFSGYVTVTAESRDALRRAAALVEQAAGQARLELRLLYGQQDVAFTCTLPLGRGLS
ncbi:MAG: SCO6880 family protein [Acidimicrobiales bacterium]